MQSVWYLYAFAILSIIHVAAEFLSDPMRIRIRHTTKPLLMPFLILYSYFHTEEPHWWIIGGLFLGWIGDVVLMFPKIAVMFLIGLASFLIGHGLFIWAFLESTGMLAGLPTWYYGLSILFAALVVGFYLYFSPHLVGENADKKVPVALYATIIMGMSFTSLGIVLLGSQSHRVVFTALPFAGSLFFIASDFLLARQLFIKPFSKDQALIMLTYLLAQYLIAQGYLPAP